MHKSNVDTTSVNNFSSVSDLCASGLLFLRVQASCPLCSLWLNSFFAGFQVVGLPQEPRLDGPPLAVTLCSKRESLCEPP